MNQPPAISYSEGTPSTDGAKMVGGSPELRAQLAKEYKESQDALRYMSLDFDEFEDMLFFQSGVHGNPEESVAEGSVPTIVLERAGRVMGQLPSGVVNALSIKDEGKSLLMNLVLKKYVYPHAKTQYSFKTKLFLWNLLANTYGSMAMVYDWVSKPGYNGPDCWLVPIRNFFPQQGRFSIADCDFVDISTFTSVLTLKQIVDDKVDNWDLPAIQEILDKIGGNNKATMPAARSDYLRNNPMWRYRRRAALTNTGDVELVTKYERGEDGHWITFAPDFGNIIIRDIPNPHETGEIPVVVKYALPTLDSIIGLGDMERGRHIQRGIDSSLNLDLDYKRLRTFPPVHVLTTGVTMPSLQMRPFAKWLMSDTNNVQSHQFPNTDSSNNLLFQMLKGAANNVSGSTTTQTSQDNAAPTQGKTPAAISAQGESQSTRDSIDRGFQDEAMEELINGFCSLINTQQKDPIDFYMFADEIKQIEQDYDDVEDIVNFEGKSKRKKSDDDDGPLSGVRTAYMKIPHSRLRNEKGYLYEIDPDSTPAENKEKQHDQLTEILEGYISDQPLVDAKLAMFGEQFQFAEAYRKWIITGSIRDAGGFIKKLSPSQLQQIQQPAAPGVVPTQPGASVVPGPSAPAPAAPALGAAPGLDPDIAAAMAQIQGTAQGGAGAAPATATAQGAPVMPSAPMVMQ